MQDVELSSVKPLFASVLCHVLIANHQNLVSEQMETMVGLF
jgi:hypothetical protein